MAASHWLIVALIIKINKRHQKLKKEDTQNVQEISKKMGLPLPAMVAPFFKYQSFSSEEALSNAIHHVNCALKNTKNDIIINSLSEFHGKRLQKMPLYGSSVSCGFASPAEDHVENQLSLDDYLISNPEATFFVRASGDSMIGAGIHDGDLLIIDRSIEVKSNHIVLAVVDTEFTIKRFFKKNNQIILKPENNRFSEITITKDQHFMVWGVVVHVIHHLK